MVLRVLTVSARRPGAWIGIFAALVELERDLFRERTVASLQATRAPRPEWWPQVRCLEGAGAAGADGDGEQGHCGGGALPGVGVGRGMLYRDVDAGGGV